MYEPKRYLEGSHQGLLVGSQLGQLRLLAFLSQTQPRQPQRTPLGWPWEGCRNGRMLSLGRGPLQLQHLSHREMQAARVLQHLVTTSRNCLGTLLPCPTSFAALAAWGTGNGTVPSGAQPQTLVVGYDAESDTESLDNLDSEGSQHPYLRSDTSMGEGRKPWLQGAGRQESRSLYKGPLPAPAPWMFELCQ